jgi:hypothetical protein
LQAGKPSEVSGEVIQIDTDVAHEGDPAVLDRKAIGVDNTPPGKYRACAMKWSATILRREVRDKPISPPGAKRPPEPVKPETMPRPMNSACLDTAELVIPRRSQVGI